MKTLNERRSIRKYSDRAVSDELLNQLLLEAERTPTMGNLQLYSVVVTRSKEMKHRLAPAHFNQPMVEGAPVVLTFCADFRRTSLWAEDRKAEPGYDNFLSFMNAATDALLYCQTFTNLAEEAGLGTCFLGTTVYMAGLTRILHRATAFLSKASSTTRPIRTTLQPTSTSITALRSSSQRTSISSR